MLFEQNAGVQGGRFFAVLQELGALVVPAPLEDRTIPSLPLDKWPHSVDSRERHSLEFLVPSLPPPLFSSDPLLEDLSGAVAPGLPIKRSRASARLIEQFGGHSVLIEPDAIKSLFSCHQKPDARVDPTTCFELVSFTVSANQQRIEFVSPPRNPHRWPSGYRASIYVDGLVGAVVTINGSPFGVLSFVSHSEKAVTLIQLQGARVLVGLMAEPKMAPGADGVKLYSFLLAVARTVAANLGYETLRIQPACESYWYNDARASRLHQAYDVTAKRAGASKGIDGWWELDLRPADMDKKFHRSSESID
jgi:hypothetical protein